MKATKILPCAMAFAIMAAAVCGSEVSTEQVQQALQKAAGHPRLLWPKDAEKQMQRRLESDPAAQAIYQAIQAQADKMLLQKPIEQIKIGRRLLDKSRTCLNRTLTLSFVYRMTGDKKYLVRAEQEMLTAAAFSDWNPSHYLDAAEMTAALAIGYDWLYADLSPASRRLICQAMIEKGIMPSFGEKEPGWVTTKMNWNQVCNGGLTLGALAIADDEPELAAKTVARAVNGIPYVMKVYDPDGAYPEGPGYWSYGTSYNVLTIAALSSALHTDFELSSMNGFSKTGDYFLQMTGPTGLFFNYADCGQRKGSFPELFWLAKHYNHPEWLFNERAFLAQWTSPEAIKSGGADGRFLPLLLIWTDSFDSPKKPRMLCWKSDGKTPVAVLRSGWDKDAAYIAVKGGGSGGNHAHMDAGSFVFDLDGVRWAQDLGSQDYNRIEQMGIRLFDMKQDSQRWHIMRYTNLWHNTLAVNGQLQSVEGSASIVHYADNQKIPQVILDLGSVYQGQLAGAFRSIELADARTVWIHDRLYGTDTDSIVRWSMVTQADISIQSDGNATLKKAGKTLAFSVRYLDDKDKSIPLKIWSAKPQSKLDEENPKTQILGFEIPVKAGRQIDYYVTLSTALQSKEKQDNSQSCPLPWPKEIGQK